MTDGFLDLLGPISTLPEKWAEEIEWRRVRAEHDPVAEALESCAAELRARIDLAAKATQPISAEAFAALPRNNTTAQTVRRWCRDGQIPGAVQTAQGWEIPREAQRLVTTAKPVRRRRARLAA